MRVIGIDSWVQLVTSVGIVWAMVCATRCQSRVVVASHSAVSSDTWNFASITVGVDALMGLMLAIIKCKSIERES